MKVIYVEDSKYGVFSTFYPISEKKEFKDGNIIYGKLVFFRRTERLNRVLDVDSTMNSVRITTTSTSGSYLRTRTVVHN